MAKIKIEYNAEQISIKSQLSIIPLRDVVVFPHMIYPLLIGREFTMRALKEAMDHDKLILLVAQRSASVDRPAPEDLYKTGVVARILQVMKMPNGTLKVLVEGMVRCEVNSIVAKGEYLAGEISLK